jgi:hypothetical protein
MPFSCRSKHIAGNGVIPGQFSKVEDTSAALRENTFTADPSIMQRPRSVD